MKINKPDEVVSFSAAGVISVDAVSILKACFEIPLHPFEVGVVFYSHICVFIYIINTLTHTYVHVCVNAY